MQQTIEECPYRTDIQSLILREPAITPEVVIAFIKKREISDKAMKKPVEATYSTSKRSEQAHVRSTRQQEEQGSARATRGSTEVGQRRGKDTKETKEVMKKSPRLCWQFKEGGVCKFGDECRFSHDPNESSKAGVRRAQASEDEEEDSPPYPSDDESEGVVRQIAGKKVLFSATLVGKMGTTHFNAQTKALSTVRAASREPTTQGHARRLKTRLALRLVIKRELPSKSSTSKETGLSLFRTTLRMIMSRLASLLLTGRVPTTPPIGQMKGVTQMETREGPTTVARVTMLAG
jgi:hypothetical protein